MKSSPIDISSCDHLADVFQQAARIYGEHPAFASRNEAGEFKSVSFRELYSMAMSLATALIDLGVQAREHVGLFADNRFEWILADLAVILCGAADVPRGSDVTDQDIEYILNHADVKIMFVEHAKLLKKIEKNRPRLKLEKLILLESDSNSSGDDELHLANLVEKGRRLRRQGDRRVEERIANIRTEDLFTLIYTSGTTGTPRGVMLTHANIISQLQSLPINLSDGDRILSILPVWHIFERTFEICSVFFGATTYYSSIRNLREDLIKVKPTFMASAPRLWEQLYSGIINRMQDKKTSILSRSLFKAAVFCAARIKSARRFLGFQYIDLENRSLLKSVGLACLHLSNLIVFCLPYLILDLLILRKVRAIVGGALRFSCSGGGALPLHVDQFFNNIGIPVLEGYGLTETSPILSARSPGHLVIGTVGMPIAKTEIRLVDLNTGAIIYEGLPGDRPAKSMVDKKGEIYARGPQIMYGYYKDPEATAKAITEDGWFNTGDLGKITCKGHLKIVGRSKETIVLMGGENVEPVPIENKLVQSAFIEQVMVVGQDRKNLGVLIVPSTGAFGKKPDQYAQLLSDKDVHEKIRAEIKNLISSEAGFKAFEKVVQFAIVPAPFERAVELTAKLSLKRHVIQDKYADLIEKMYK